MHARELLDRRRRSGRGERHRVPRARLDVQRADRRCDQRAGRRAARNVRSRSRRRNGAGRGRVTQQKRRAGGGNGAKRAARPRPEPLAPKAPSGSLVIRGAREHNLKNLHLELPRDALVVFTGISGSGKSSLAFDTIYAEGQRRYVESLSAYARQFLGQMEKPDVDFIDGLSPAISIDQKGTSRNPRSTVGTVTEIYDYLRLLFARVGVPHCTNPECPDRGRVIERQTVQQIVD